MADITLFVQIIASFVVEKKYKYLKFDWQLVLEHREGKTLENCICGKLI